MKMFGGKKIADKNLPTLRSSSLASKTIISLSKVDFDSRNIHRNRSIKTTSHTDRQISRSQSGFNIRKNKDPKEDRIYSRGQFEGTPAFKTILRDIKEQQTQPAGLVSIEKAKVSSKGYGLVKAYSANSHPGPILSYNEDRICIVTNLTKTNVRHKQISFFGIYDGKDGATKADYMRDNFHLCLIEDQTFPKDIQFSLKRTLKRLKNAFNEDPKHTGDQSSVSFVIVLIFNEQVYYLQSGTCRAVFSTSFGQKIFFPCASETTLLTKQPHKSRSVSDLVKKGRWRELGDLQYRKFTESQQLDCILLGSEGLFQNMRIRDIGRRFWLYFLKNKHESIHFAVGQANNNIMADVFNNLGTKNSSLIVIAFEPVQQCLQNVQDRSQMILPQIGQV